MKQGFVEYITLLIFFFFVFSVISLEVRHSQSVGHRMTAMGCQDGTVLFCLINEETNELLQV